MSYGTFIPRVSSFSRLKRAMEIEKLKARRLREKKIKRKNKELMKTIDVILNRPIRQQKETHKNTLLKRILDKFAPKQN